MLQMRQMVMARRICAILEELASLCRAQASPHATSDDADHMRENMCCLHLQNHLCWGVVAFLKKVST